MSYDVYVGDWSSNMTSNVGKVFYAHTERGIPGLDGMTGLEAAKALSNCLVSLAEERRKMHRIEGTIGEPELCAKYDSPNGWGSLVGAILWAGEIISACLENPDHIVEVCY